MAKHGYIRDNGILDTTQSKIELTQHCCESITIEPDNGNLRFRDLVKNIRDNKSMIKSDYIVVHSLPHIDSSMQKTLSVILRLKRAKIYVYSILEKFDSRKTDVAAYFHPIVNIENARNGIQSLRVEKEKKRLMRRNYKSNIQNINRVFNEHQYLEKTVDDLAKKYNKSKRTIQRYLKKYRDTNALEMALT